MNVGLLRNFLGIGHPLRESDAENVNQELRNVTQAALRAAEVSSLGDRRLIAYVEKFWLDGYGDATAEVQIRYMLVDPSGMTRWEKTLVRRTSGVVWDLVGSRARKFAEKLYDRALRELVIEAERCFRDPAFRQALS